MASLTRRKLHSALHEDRRKAVFDAKEIVRMPGPDGKIMHAVLKMGDSRIFVNDNMGQSIPVGSERGVSNPTFLHMYVADVDAIFERAIGIATHKEDVAPEDLKRRQDAFFAKAAGQR